MDAQRLQKYLRAECTPAEAQTVLLYLATGEGQRRLKQLLDEDLEQLAELPLNAQEQTAAQKLFERIQLQKQPVRSLGQRHRWLVAATMSLAILAAGLGWLYRYSTSDQRITVRTGFGQTRQVQLPDQSVVTLNGNTSVTYPKRWSTKLPREIWVKGEAFFEIVHTKNHQPFTVHLPGHLNIEVLGTRFNVYTRKAQTQVVLNDGRIRMKGDNAFHNQLLMRPGDLFYADTQTHVFYKKRVNPQVFATWRSDKLTFEGTTLVEVARRLEEIYGIPIAIPDKELQQQRVSGTIPSKSMNTVLMGLSRLFDIKITRQPNQIELSKTTPL